MNDRHPAGANRLFDAKEFFEYTPGVLRANVKAAHLDALTFNLQPVLERRMGVKFIWGEVKSLDGIEKTATIKPTFFHVRLLHDLFRMQFRALPFPRRILVVPIDPRGELLGSH